MTDSLLCPDKRRMMFMFRSHDLRPAVFDEVYADAMCVIGSVARCYVDNSRVELHYPELMSEGQKKLAQLIDSGKFDKFPSRADFFSYFKLTVKRHIIGVMKASVMTGKRNAYLEHATDHDEAELEAVVDDGEEDHIEAAASAGRSKRPFFNTTKKTHLSIDDEEARVQVADMADHGEGLAFVRDDISPSLTATELMIYDQLISPNDHTIALAFIEGARAPINSRGKLAKVEVAIDDAMNADGLGLPLETFLMIKKTLQEKVRRYMDKLQPEDKFYSATKQLEQVFELQCPRTLPLPVVRRLFTIAAVHKSNKLNPQVIELLQTVGAKVPSAEGQKQTRCFGILYQKNHRACSVCGLAASCAVEAANYGLGEVTLHPSVLGAKLTRNPAITFSSDEAVEHEDAVVNHAQDEVLDYLRHHFIPLRSGNATYFCHKAVGTQGKGRIFWVGPKHGRPLVVQFCSPDEELSAKLHFINNGYFLPEEASATTGIKLIDQHAADLMGKLNGEDDE